VLAPRQPNIKAGQVFNCRVTMGSFAADGGYLDDPVGTIKPFYTSYPTVLPSGWALCDGSNGTVDLRDRFIMATIPA
jgi:hypothetical protein